MTTTADDRYLDGQYLEDNPTWHSDHAPWKATHILRVLREAGETPTSICDVGCGTGDILRGLVAEYPAAKLTGYDISPQAVALARADSYGVEIIEGDFREDARTFDLVMAIDVFEHVENYYSFLRDLRAKAPTAIFHIPLELGVYSLLRDRRTLMAYRQRLGHLHHFSRETALAALRDTGWAPRHMRYTHGIFAHDQLSWKRRLKWAPVAGLSKLNENAAAKIAGGFSLMVLADRD